MIRPYIWWTDEPWAALLALGVVIIVVSIFSIVVVFYTYSRNVLHRFTKLSQPRRMLSNFLTQPHRDVPRTIPREYETQSLNIYVPHDDALSDVTDFKIAFAESSMEFISYKDQKSNVAETLSSK